MLRANSLVGAIGALAFAAAVAHAYVGSIRLSPSIESAPGGQHYLRVIPDSTESENWCLPWVEVTAYVTKREPEADAELWRAVLPRGQFRLSRNGWHLAWVSWSESERGNIIEFFAGGEFVGGVGVRDIVDGQVFRGECPDSWAWSAVDYKFLRDQYFLLVTGEGIEFRFDASTGEVLGRRPYEGPHFRRMPTLDSK